MPKFCHKMLLNRETELATNYLPKLYHLNTALKHSLISQFPVYNKAYLVSCKCMWENVTVSLTRWPEEDLAQLHVG